MIEIPLADYESIVAHAQETYPNECCGLLAGRGGVVTRVYRMTNADQSPVTFRVDPRDLIQAFQEMDDRGLDLIGIYHSHTHSPAYPSPTDVDYSRGYPDAAHLIVSLADREMPTVRCFRIMDGRIHEEELLAR